MDLTPPRVNTIAPAQGSAAAPKNSLIRADFNEIISAGSVVSDNFKIFETVCNNNINFPTNPTCYPAGGFSVYKEDQSNSSSVLLSTYDPYLDGLKSYNPRLNSQIKDLYQNCFYPAAGPCVAGQNSPGCE